MSLNRIVLQGRLCADPDLRRTNGGTAVTNFNLAVDRDFKSEDGSRETDFISVICWKGLAEMSAKWFKKGQMAVVSGRLQIRQYTDKSGQKRSQAEVVADNVYFCESKKDRDEDDYARTERAGKQEYQPARKPVSVEADDGDGELPFD